MKPCIAILTNYPADFTTFTGGVETATAALLEGLREHQDTFEFHLISAPKGLEQDIRMEREGFHFHFLSTPGLFLARPRLFFRINKGLRELRDISPDLVHCQDNMPFALAAILSGYPQLFTIHGVKRHEANKRNGWERWSASADAVIERYVHRRFQWFICISDYVRRVVGNGKHLFSIPNPVRPAFFKTRRVILDHPLLLFVGALIPLKQPTKLLYAHRELRKRFPTLETAFCGVFEDSKYRRQMQSEKVDGVHFIGRVEEEKLAKWFSQATALVLPSTQENLPIVIAEAMAAGVPVVATTVGGIPEMVEHGETGFLHDVEDVDGMVELLERLLSDPVLQTEMCQRARQKALDTYYPNKVARQTVQVYQTMLSLEK